MLFTIDSENNITAIESNAAIPDNAQQFSSEKELGKLAADWPAERLVDIWNSLPGVKPFKKFTNRNTAAGRIWNAIQSLGRTVPNPRPHGVEPRPRRARRPVPSRRSPQRATAARKPR